MKKEIQNTLWALIIAIAFTACSKESTNEPNGVEGYATGKVVDGRGNPIGGAKILLDNTVYYATYINGSTNEDGTYKVKVERGSWITFAYVDKAYNGRIYNMELFPDKTDAYTQEGAVRNFTWKIEGSMPWEAEDYYGASIELSSDIYFNDDIEDVELVLTPKGPLIDGSEGRVLTLHYGDGKWKQRYLLRDIPIGRYMVKATLKKNNQSRPLKIQDWYNPGNAMSEFQLDFKPKSDNTIRISASLIIGN